MIVFTFGNMACPIAQRLAYTVLLRGPLRWPAYLCDFQRLRDAGNAVSVDQLDGLGGHAVLDGVLLLHARHRGQRRAAAAAEDAGPRRGALDRGLSFRH